VTSTPQGSEPGGDPFDRGTPGRSAEAEYRRRVARDEARRQKQFGRLAWLATLLTTERQSTRAWSAGADGERRVAAALEQALGQNGIVLHDRRTPWSRGNIDHIAVAPSGVWVVDAKEYRGRVRRRDTRLYVGRRDRSSDLAGVRRQRDAVRRMLQRNFGDESDRRERHDRAPPLHAAICLVGAEWDWWARPFRLDGVWVAWPGRLGRMLLRPTVLRAEQIGSVASALAREFPVR
jgi:hypothetical protein